MLFVSVYKTCKFFLAGNEPGHHSFVHMVSGVITMSNYAERCVVDSFGCC